MPSSRWAWPFREICCFQNTRTSFFERVTTVTEYYGVLERVVQPKEKSYEVRTFRDEASRFLGVSSYVNNTFWKNGMVFQSLFHELRMARYSDGSLGGTPRVIGEVEGLNGRCFDSSHSKKVESATSTSLGLMSWRCSFREMSSISLKYEKLRPKHFSVQGILFGVLLAVWDTPQNFNRTSSSTSFFSFLPSKLQNTLGVSIQKKLFLSPLMRTLALLV